jgi:hypothetical protein
MPTGPAQHRLSRDGQRGGNRRAGRDRAHRNGDEHSDRRGLRLPPATAVAHHQAAGCLFLSGYLSGSGFRSN